MLAVLGKDKDKKMKSLNAEINNGRLAMMAIIGILPGKLPATPRVCPLIRKPQPCALLRGSSFSKRGVFSVLDYLNHPNGLGGSQIFERFFGAP